MGRQVRRICAGALISVVRTPPDLPGCRSARGRAAARATEGGEVARVIGSTALEAICDDLGSSDHHDDDFILDQAVGMNLGCTRSHRRRDVVAPGAYHAVERLLVDTVARLLVRSGETCAGPGGETRPDDCCIDAQQMIRSSIGGAGPEEGLDSVVVEQLTCFFDTILAGLAARARDGAGRPELQDAVLMAMRTWPKRERPEPAQS